MKTLLSSFEPPIISSLWFYSDQLVIIKDVDADKNWLYNNFINLRSNSNELPNYILFNGYNFNLIMSQFFDCPYIHTQRILFDINKNINGIDIIKTIENSIDNGFFVLLMINRKYIKSYGFSGDNSHQVLVHSYDKNNQTLLLCDNFLTGKFKIDILCTYEELTSSFLYNTDFHNHPELSDSIFIFKAVQNNHYNLNLCFINKQLKQYLGGFGTACYEDIFGIDIYNGLIKSIDDIVYNDSKLYMFNGICVFNDHKKIMLDRLSMLSTKKIIPNNYYEKYKDIVEMSTILVNMFVKYKFTNQSNILIKCKSILNEMSIIETYILKNVIKLIDESIL